MNNIMSAFPDFEIDEAERVSARLLKAIKLKFPESLDGMAEQICVAVGDLDCLLVEFEMLIARYEAAELVAEMEKDDRLADKGGVI